MNTVTKCRIPATVAARYGTLGHRASSRNCPEVLDDSIAHADEPVVEIDRRVAMGLYPYTYSAGLTASTAVYKLMEDEGQPVIDRWLEVLKAGGTKDPLELMQHAGVDMSKPDAIRTAIEYIGSLVDGLERSYE